MQIGRVQLLEFRNYPTLSWHPAPHLNVLAGPNAQGKTNLLEALGFLVTGRSFRTSRSAEIPSWGIESATLTAFYGLAKDLDVLARYAAAKRGNVRKLG